jgi:hypothetical protein
VFPLSQPGHLPGLVRLERGFVFKTLTLKSLLGFSTMVEVDWKHLTYMSVHELNVSVSFSKII